MVDAAAPPAPGAIDDLVRRIRLVPDLLRDFSESQTDAVRIHRVGRSLLDRLVQAGLPFAGDGAERRFDPLDLANVGLDLGLPSAHRLAMRWWSRALAEIDEGGVTDCVLTVRCACPAPGHPGACDFTLNPESANTPEVLEASRQSDNGYALRLRLSRLERCFAGDQLAVIAEAASIAYHVLPLGIRADADFVARTRIADCRFASAYLVEQARAAGLEVRRSAGFLISAPYATEHSWVDFLVDGEWLPADPVLISALARWGVVSEARWPVRRALCGVLWRTGETRPVLVRHGGEAVYERPLLTRSG